MTSPVAIALDVLAAVRGGDACTPPTIAAGKTGGWEAAAAAHMKCVDAALAQGYGTSSYGTPPPRVR
jgi:hypothetical protein